jgi:hypothetical protein
MQHPRDRISQFLHLSGKLQCKVCTLLCDRLAALGEPRAKTARYSRARRKFVVELTNGCTFMFPVDMAQDLTGATDSELADVEVLGSGFGLHWEKLDADLAQEWAKFKEGFIESIQAMINTVKGKE